MSNPTDLNYRLSEADHYKLYRAKHLVQLLTDLTDRPTNANNVISIDSESFVAVMSLLHDQLDVAFIS